MNVYFVFGCFYQPVFDLRLFGRNLRLHFSPFLVDKNVQLIAQLHNVYGWKQHK